MTGPQERDVLAALSLNWVMRSQHVWESTAGYVPELHAPVAQQVSRAIAEARKETEGNPLGLVLEGEAGTGKTHLLGWVREEVRRGGGYFFLVKLTHGETFWENVVESLLDGLGRAHVPGDDTQLRTLLKRLGTMAGTSRTIRSTVEGRPTKQGLDRFLEGLAAASGLPAGLRNTVRALALFAAEDLPKQDHARAYFLSAATDPQAQHEFGLGAPPGPERIVQHLSQLIAMTGHTVIAVDQLDPLIARAATSVRTVDHGTEDARRDELVTQVGSGLMELQEGTRRTLVLLACIPNSWALISQRGLVTVSDRFRAPLQVKPVPSADLARAIVAEQLAVKYRELGFVPPYATWPVADSAFASAQDTTPRFLLQRIDAHVRSCLESGAVTELTSFTETASGPSGTNAPAAGDLDKLDRHFEELRAAAQVATALDQQQEDLALPPLLRAGLRAWIAERGDAAQRYKEDDQRGTKPAVHGGLRETLDESVEAQTYTAFRAIAWDNAIAFQSRLKRAMLATGIDGQDRVQRLFVLRQGDWPGGPKTKALVGEFIAKGGVRLEMGDDDLRTFEALRQLLDEDDQLLQSWLVARQPASSTALFRSALPLPELPEPDAPQAVPGEAAVRVGTVDGRPSWIGLESLRKHVAVFAGSGSGKTVLLRRLIEECALQGVSSIVLDPNNDLARLGDAWPEPPRFWDDGDEECAAEYLAGTDVVVWTPRMEGGRPLTFQPLPDLAGVLDDGDEFRQAVDVAVSALAPRARADGRTTKAERQRAVLRQALEHFARGGAGSMEDFVDVLGDLPPEASTIKNAEVLAADMAQTLTAAMVNDPLFGGTGAPVDPGLLLTPAPGKRARISVISFVGLPDDAQRQGFVSQLQMALFPWFKRNPAADRPLGGLLVMDEAQTIAPSGAMTASTESTLVLASQARKYGLGLVFATQAPKGLHNRIPGNAATQFFGYLNSPAQINTAAEIARAKGGDVSGISRLTTGQFYVAREGTAFEQIRTFNCLSHHPSSPLSNEEVLARARAGR